MKQNHYIYKKKPYVPPEIFIENMELEHIICESALGSDDGEDKDPDFEYTDPDVDPFQTAKKSHFDYKSFDIDY